MKTIKYTVNVEFIAKDGKEIKLETYASSASELLKNIDDVLNKKSKNWIERLFEGK